VILFEIDPEGVAILELECDAPRPVHVDRVAGGIVPSQRMEIEPGQVHILRPLRAIERIETPKNAVVKRRIDPSRTALCQSSLKPLLLNEQMMDV
jgi:hypothetical protein